MKAYMTYIIHKPTDTILCPINENITQVLG